MGTSVAAATTRSERPIEQAVRAAQAGGLRREGGEERPLGAKARRTRAALLAAARELFTCRGYQQTTVGDIAEAAGVSLGTFYQYFRDRPGIMAALVGDGLAEQLSSAPAVEGNVRDTVSQFVRHYAETAAFQAVWEEVTHIDPELAELRRDLSRYFYETLERQLAKAVRRGSVRADLDPKLAAIALNAMIDRFCYTTFCFDPVGAGVVDVDRAVDQLSALWTHAVGWNGR